MLYLLDANVLIDANRDYYPIDRVPEFWDWLQHIGEKGLAKIPLEIYEEIKSGEDELGRWARQSEVKSALLLDETVDVNLVARAVEQGYAPDLSDDELEKLGRDPFLVAYGLVAPSARCVVTTEVSRPAKQRGNRKLPDVCSDFQIRSCTTFEFVRVLDFSTAWRANQ